MKIGKMEYENDKWSEFERVALSPDDSERTEYLKELILNYPESYFTILGNVYSTFQHFDGPPAFGFVEYTNEEKIKISSFFHQCVDLVHEGQTTRQKEFIENKYNEVRNTNDPAVLEDIKFRIIEYFIIPSNRPNGCFSLFDPINLRDNEYELAEIDGRILRKDASFEELENYISDKIRSLKERGELQRYNPEPSPKQDKGQTTMPNTEATEAPKLVWTANKNHLYELIYALRGVKSLQTQDGRPATLKDILSAFNVIGKFEDGRGISQHQLYNKFEQYIKNVRDRAKGNRFFADNLQSAYIKSLKAQIEEEIRTRDSKN